MTWDLKVTSQFQLKLSIPQEMNLVACAFSVTRVSCAIFLARLAVCDVVFLYTGHVV